TAPRRRGMRRKRRSGFARSWVGASILRAARAASFSRGGRVLSRGASPDRRSPHHFCSRDAIDAKMAAFALIEVDGVDTRLVPVHDHRLNSHGARRFDEVAVDI